MADAGRIDIEGRAKKKEKRVGFSLSRRLVYGMDASHTPSSLYIYIYIRVVFSSLSFFLSGRAAAAAPRRPPSLKLRKKSPPIDLCPPTSPYTFQMKTKPSFFLLPFKEMIGLYKEAALHVHSNIVTIYDYLAADEPSSILGKKKEKRFEKKQHKKSTRKIWLRQ